MDDTQRVTRPATAAKPWSRPTLRRYDIADLTRAGSGSFIDGCCGFQAQP